MSAGERVSVKTTVPESQKRAWADHADALDMSQSEFFRTMVQAGRRGFELDSPELHSQDAHPGGSGLDTPILEILDDGGYHEFDEIVERLADEFEELVDDTLQSLTASGTVKVSGRKGYALAGGVDGDS